MLGNQMACWSLLSSDSQRHINGAPETSSSPTVKAVTAVGEVWGKKKAAGRPSVTGCDMRQKAVRSAPSILLTAV